MWQKLGAILVFEGRYSGPEPRGNPEGAAFVAIIEKLLRRTVAEMRQSLAVLPGFQGHPFKFLARYVRRHPLGHAVVLGSVLPAVACSVGTQYGMKHLIDVISRGPQGAGTAVWWAFALLGVLIAADNLLWRVGGYAAARTYVAVTGDIRSELFAYLSGHSPSYFAERLPGALAGRIGAAANAAFTIENTGSWNVLPPSIAVVFSVALIGLVNPWLALTLVGFSLALGGLVFWLARRGTPLHRSYAEKAAAVDGELVDVVGNFHVVRAFGATLPRAAPHRPHGGNRDGRPAHQPVLYGAAAADPRRADRGGQRRRHRLGHSAVAGGAGLGGRHPAGDQPGHHHPALHPRPRGGAGRSHPARRAAGGGDRRAADAA